MTLAAIVSYTPYFNALIVRSSNKKHYEEIAHGTLDQLRDYAFKHDIKIVNLP